LLKRYKQFYLKMAEDITSTELRYQTNPVYKGDSEAWKGLTTETGVAHRLKVPINHLPSINHSTRPEKIYSVMKRCT